MSLIKSVLRIGRRTLLIAIVILVAVAFSPIWIPWVIIVSLRGWLRFMRFRRRHAGQTFLIWRSRRGWHDFIRNNVLPVLPTDVQVLHDRRPRPRAARMILCEKPDWQDNKGANPLLAFVTPRNVRIVSLNTELQSLKRQARRTPVVQATVARIIRDVIRSGSPR